MSNSNLNKSRQLLIDSFIKCLDEETLPWSKGWATMNMNEMQNPISKTKYRGNNALLLMIVAFERGYSDPRWCTYKQAEDKGWAVKKGSKGVPVEFWSIYDKTYKKAISFREYDIEILKKGRDKEEFRPMSRVYTVFNASCINGIPEYVKLESIQLNDIEMNSFIENAIKNMDVGYREFGNEAYYTPVLDTVTMPPRGQFKTQYEFNSTLLHELSHATGHESRLNRNLKNPFGSERYAEEELRAEMSSVFLSQYLHIDIADSRLDNHKAYVQSWSSSLKKDPNILFKAIKEAEGIADYIIEKGEYELIRSPEGQVPQKQSLDDMIKSAEKKKQVQDHDAPTGIKDYAMAMGRL